MKRRVTGVVNLIDQRQILFFEYFPVWGYFIVVTDSGMFPPHSENVVTSKINKT